MPTVLYGYSRDERAYCLLESTYGQTPNSGGASSLAGSNCFSFNSIDLNLEVETYESEFKTGSRSIPPGQPGRRIGSFRITVPLKGSGTPGVPPDYGPILTSSFGAQTIAAGASVGYTLVDNPPQTFSLYRYRQPAGLFQQLGISCIPTRTTWNLGQNMANWSLEGQCFWVLDSEQFAVADVYAKAGLTAFPTEPTTPVVNGSQTQGYKGLLTVDTFPLVNIQTMQVVAEWGNTHNRTFFGTDYPAGILGGTRRVTCSMEAYDDNSAAMVDLRAKGISKAPMNATMTIGVVAGNIHTLNCHAAQLPFPELIDTGDRFGLRWTNIMLHESTPGAKDELTMTLT